MSRCHRERGRAPQRSSTRAALLALLASIFASPLLSIGGGANAQQTQAGSQAPPARPAAPGMLTPGAPVDVELESAQTGRPVRLSSLRSKVVVLFYEDREHIPQNEELKGNIQRFIADNHLEQQLAMVPIANADGFHYAPVDSLVRGGLAEASRRIGLDILIDWDRRMYAAPFEMRSGASNVVVIDRQGRMLFRHAGLVGEQERTSLFRAIRMALRSGA